MILTTTNSIENKEIVEYLGIVTGSAYNSSYYYQGNKMSLKDMFKMSKYYEAYSEGLESIKKEAFKNLEDNALKLEANAIVGITLDVEPVANSTTLLVSITGTAVKIR